MNTLISIIQPEFLPELTAICQELSIPVTLALYGHGTATKSMRSVLGIESTDKRIVITVADERSTSELIEAERQRLYIDAPGNGIVISLPVKSLGGAAAMAILNQSGEKKKAPVIDPDYELVLVIANEGATDLVMDAARAAGARGGTVLHAKGTGSKEAERFYSVSIASEKECVLIVAAKESKADIMSAILQKAGKGTRADAFVFSLPVSKVGGFMRK